MNFEEVRSGGCQTYLLSGPITIPDYGTVYVCIKIDDCESIDKEWAEQGAYWVGIDIVSPEKAPRGTIADILSEYGLDSKQGEEIDPAIIAEGLVQDGCSATVWKRQDDDEEDMIAEAKAFAATIPGNFAKLMNYQQNAVGVLGWDWVKGSTSPLTDKERERIPCHAS